MSTQRNNPVPDQVFDTAVIIHLTSVLTTRFPNGFRDDSDIEIERLKNYYRLEYGSDLPLTDTDLRETVGTLGVRHAGKLFVITSNTQNSLSMMLDIAFSSGAKLIFYDAFYQKHEEWLSEVRIYSSDMLKNVLRGIFPQFYFSRSYFSKRRRVTPESEIIRCFSTDRVLNYTQISAKLPYISLTKIKQLLAQNNDFIWVSPEHYTHISMVKITVKDRRSIGRFLAEKLKHSNYVSTNELDISAIAEHNAELSAAAIRNAVYQKCLSEDYEKRGNIITKKGEPMNIREILMKYCLEHDIVTFDEINELERSLGEHSHSACLVAAYRVMVRVNRDLFVADNEIDFDIDQIDATLEVLCPSDYVPLQSIKDFSLFPYVGYPWNGFLLESYVRRFSQRFRFDAPSVNSKCAGAIIRRASGFTDYRKILADAAAKADIPLDEETVTEFLAKRGFLGRRSLSQAGSVVAEAKKIRERGM